MPEYLTVKNAAEMLNVTVHFVYNEIKSGRLKAIRLGERILRISMADFDAYIAQNKY